MFGVSLAKTWASPPSSEAVFNEEHDDPLEFGGSAFSESPIGRMLVNITKNKIQHVCTYICIHIYIYIYIHIYI